MVKFAVFPKWYVKIYRYNIRENQLRDSTIEWTKRYLQWSWMKFLIPLTADENTINVAELIRHTINILENETKVKVSLRFILNSAKIHPVQLSGVTNLINYAKKLDGSEIPFRNFRYIYENSLIQWIHEEGDINEELLNMWSYEND